MAGARPRLVYVVTLAEVGGAQSYVRGLLAATHEEFEVSLAAHGNGPLRDAAAQLGVPFIPLRHVRRALSPIHDPLGLLELTLLFRRLRPDLVHLNSSKAGILGRLAAGLARVPIRVFTAHGWAFKATSGLGAQLYLWADRVVRPLTTMASIYRRVADRAASRLLAARTCTAAKATVISNGVDMDGARPNAGSIEPGAIEIVSVGRLAEPKDFSTLVEAMARLEPGAVRLRVLGDGPLRASLEAQIADRGVSAAVELVGEVADVRPYLGSSDVFVLSSRSEGMPLSVLEAMAALPPGCCDGSGRPERGGARRRDRAARRCRQRRRARERAHSADRRSGAP